MDSMDNRMVLKDPSGFKYVHDNRCLGHSNGKVFVFKMSLDQAGSGADLVRCMQHGGDVLDNVDHVKGHYDCTSMVGHVYNNKHCKVLTISCCELVIYNQRIGCPS